MLSRHRAFGVLTALLGAIALAAGPASGQTTTSAPTVTETQSFTVTIPPPKPASHAPSSSGTSNAGTGVGTSVAATPLPGRLAYTGADPWLIIAGGALIAGLSLLARRRARS